MQTVQWYLQRLKVMSLREIAHRSAEPARLGLLKLERRLRSRRIQTAEWRRFAFCTAAIEQLPHLSYAFAPSHEERARILAGDWGALGFPWAWKPQAGIWHTAPDTGRTWPGEFFSSIAYRVGNPYGDARVVWEPARLQGLVALALLARQRPDCALPASELAERVLDSWVRLNPYLCGPHYISAMECALRLMAVCHCLDMMRGALRHRPAWGLLPSMVSAHAGLISKRLSLHSSAGNHLIAECAGLIYAGTLFPEDPRAAAWRATGISILERESPRQILPDGGGCEQSFGYQLFVVDLLGLIARLVGRSGTCPAAIEDAAARGREFLGAFAKRLEDLPPVGDSDAGAALTPHLRISFDAVGQVPVPSRTFPDSGYTLCQSEPSTGLRVLIDHGPLGMPPSYGHGHADALSVTASVHGQDMLIDPGTYGYNLGADWRRYFRSTQAHNTVTVDGLDQAVQGGTFLWRSPYHTYYHAPVPDNRGSICCLVMRHDGYREVGVVHWRVVLVQTDGTLVVLDRLHGSGEHELELNWHLGVEPAPVAGDAQRLTLSNKYCFEVRGGELSLHRGESDPPRAWRSRHYGLKSPSVNLRSQWRGSVPHEFASFIWPESVAIDADASLERLRRLLACCENA
jgi:hypothetical protein